METRYFKSLGDQVSLLGYGLMRLPRLYKGKQDIDYTLGQKLIDYAINNGVNYFDTAWVYHEGQSESFIGEALLNYHRDKFFLATKMPTWLIKKPEDVETIFNKQLEKCKVDYFDYYLIHNLALDTFKICEENNIYNILKKKKDEGKIRHLGFSFHDSPALLREIVKTHKWDFAQIQLNYLDWVDCNAKEQYNILLENSLPVIIMEPVRGGALAKLNEEAAQVLKKFAPNKSIASWAIRYAAGLPNVLTVLSGMGKMDQVSDNINTMNNFAPLSEDEYKVLNTAAGLYRASGTIPCTNCRYCMDCPTGIDIPRVFAIYNNFCITHNPTILENTYNTLIDKERAHNCISCGKCKHHCPQHIDIPAKMKEISDAVKKSLI